VRQRRHRTLLGLCTCPYRPAHNYRSASRFLRAGEGSAASRSLLGSSSKSALRGWTEIGPDPSLFSIAGVIEVSWEETNRPHHLEIIIVDADGQRVQVPTPTGDQPFLIVADINVGRPPTAVPGQSFIVPIAVNIPPLPFEPGHDYVVRALIGGLVQDETAFRFRPRPPAAPAPA
jgi:hypothetical protein